MFLAPSRPAPPSPFVEHSVLPPIQQRSSSRTVEPEVEEGAWTQFQKLTQKAMTAVKSTEEKLKELEKTTVAKEIKDESYLARIGFFFLRMLNNHGMTK